MKIVANNYETKDIIRIMRECTNKTQPDFGKQIGMSGSSIQSYERGIRKYKFETLMKIAHKYNFVVIIEKNEPYSTNGK